MAYVCNYSLIHQIFESNFRRDRDSRRDSMGNDDENGYCSDDEVRFRNNSESMNIVGGRVSTCQVGDKTKL